MDTIGDGQDLVDRRIRDVFGTKEQTSVIEWESTGLSDSEVLDRFLNDRTGTKFRRLWSGDFYEVGYDESRAEFTIARKLNFYTGDPEQTERIMRNNPNIARQKWDTHRTYLVGTITKADPEKFHTPSSDLEINVSPQDSTQLSNHGLYKARDDDWNEFLPSYTTDELYDMAREETPWVMEGIAAKGAVTDFYGPAKHGGKTTFMTHACASIVEGVPFIGCDVRKDKILYLTEMAPDNFKDYLQKAGIRKGEDFRTVFKMDVWELPWGLLIDAAGKMCANEGRGGLVVDTFAEFSDVRGTEENNAGDVHEKLSALRKVAQVHDLAVILIRHANKEGKGRGSSAFEASVDIVIGYKRPDKASSECSARVLDGVGRWNESNFTTNVELTVDGFTDCGDERHVLFTKAVRAIKDTAPLGRQNAMERNAFVVEGVSAATINRALDWLLEKEELCRTGAGKKGYPRRFYVPTIHSNHDPGAYTEDDRNPQEGGQVWNGNDHS